MEITPKHKRKVTPEKSQEILEKHGTVVTLKEAEIIFELWKDLQD